MRRIVVSLLLMVGSILATAAKVAPMTFAHEGATDTLKDTKAYALTDHLGSYVRLYTMTGDSVLIASYDPFFCVGWWEFLLRLHLGSHVFISWFWSTSSWHEQHISTSFYNCGWFGYIWIVRRWMDRRSHAGI